jgi:uncharacterized protein (TIGR03905 family)
MFSFTTRGVCAKNILFDIEDGLVKKVEFLGGCNGNLQGISRLIENMPVEEAIERLSGIRCGNRSTSCPDQLALALIEGLKKQTA